MYSALSTFNTTTEVPLSKALNLQLLPGRRSIHGVCVFTTVCMHLDGLNAEQKFRVWVTILGHMSLHFHFLSLIQVKKDFESLTVFSVEYCKVGLNDWRNKKTVDNIH